MATKKFSWKEHKKWISEFADAVIEVLNNHQSYKANLAVFLRENSVQAEQQLLLDSVSNIMLDNIYS